MKYLTTITMNSKSKWVSLVSLLLLALLTLYPLPSRATKYPSNNPYSGCNFDQYRDGDSGIISASTTVRAQESKCAINCQNLCSSDFSPQTNGGRKQFYYRCIQKCQSNQPFTAHPIEVVELSSSGKQDYLYATQSKVVNPPAECADSQKNYNIANTPISVLQREIIFDQNEFNKQSKEKQDSQYIAFTINRRAPSENRRIALCGMSEVHLVPLPDNLFSFIPESMGGYGNSASLNIGRPPGEVSTIVDVGQNGLAAGNHPTILSTKLDSIINTQWNTVNNVKTLYRAHPCFAHFTEPPNNYDIVQCIDCVKRSGAEPCLKTTCQAIAKGRSIETLEDQGCFLTWALGVTAPTIITNTPIANGDELSVFTVGDIVFEKQGNLYDSKTQYFESSCNSSFASLPGVKELTSLNLYLGKNPISPPMIGSQSFNGTSIRSICDPMRTIDVGNPAERQWCGLQPSCNADACGVLKSRESQNIVDVVLPRHGFSGRVSSCAPIRDFLGFKMPDISQMANIKHGGVYVQATWSSGIIADLSALQYTFVPSDFDEAGFAPDALSKLRWYNIDQQYKSKLMEYDYLLPLSLISNQIASNGQSRKNSFIILLRINPNVYSQLNVANDEVKNACSLSKSIGSFDVDLSANIIHENAMGTVTSFLGGLIKSTRDALFGSKESPDNSPFHAFFQSVTENFRHYISIILVIYLMNQSLLFLLGFSQTPVRHFIDSSLKLSIIATLVTPTGWQWMSEFAIPLFVDGSMEVAYKLSAKYVDDYSRIAQGTSLDDIFNSFSNICLLVTSTFFWERWAALVFSGFLGLGIAICLLIIVVVAFTAMIRIALIFCLGLLGTAFLLTLSPVFLMFSLFQSTKNFFTQWFKAIMFYAITPVFLVLLVSIIGELIFISIRALISFPICNVCILRFDFLGVLDVCIIPGKAPLVSMHIPKNNEYGNLIAPGISNFTALLCSGFLAYFLHQAVDYCTQTLFRIIAFTAGRGDLSHAGVAKEFSAAIGKELKATSSDAYNATLKGISGIRKRKSNDRPQQRNH